MQCRINALLEWLETAGENVEIKCAPYPQATNRLIICNDFVLEGFRLHDSSGYEMSVVLSLPERIRAAEDEFITFWNSVRQDRTSAIAELRDRCEEVEQRA